MIDVVGAVFMLEVSSTLVGVDVKPMLPVSLFSVLIGFDTVDCFREMSFLFDLTVEKLSSCRPFSLLLLSGLTMVVNVDSVGGDERFTFCTLSSVSFLITPSVILEHDVDSGCMLELESFT